MSMSTPPAPVIGLWNLRRVVEETGLSKRTIARLRQRNNFPAPRELGIQTLQWLAQDVIDWMNNLPPSGTHTV